MTLSRRTFLRSATAVGATLAAGAAFHRPQAASGTAIRPPGALEESEFLARCIRCGQCGDACPNRAISVFTAESGRELSIAPGAGEEGTPVIFPRRQACNLCAGAQGDALLCTAACPSGALALVQKNREDIQAGVDMGTAVVDPNLCHSFQGASCGVCVRACPFGRDALRAGMLERPIVDPEFCVGCGLCERSCIRYPQAITVRPRGAGGAA